MTPTEKAENLGLALPPSYLRAKELGLVNLAPWFFLPDQTLAPAAEQVNKRFPSRSVLPFARRTDCDDIACFVALEPGRASGEVVVIHDYTMPGMEAVQRFPSFWDWFKSAINDMIEADLVRHLEEQ